MSSSVVVRLVPHVDLCWILWRTQENIRRPVPQGHYLVGVSLSRDRLGSCETWKIHQRHNDTLRFCYTKFIARMRDSCSSSSFSLSPLTKISQFELSPLIDEEILGLQVPVENFPLVTIRQPSQNLEQEDLEKYFMLSESSNVKRCRDLAILTKHS